jgi:hypothetical protein
MDMENGVTDRLWDKDVQEYIAACRHEKLSDITLGYSTGNDGQFFLTASALYLSLKGRVVPIGYHWADLKSGRIAEVHIGKAKAPAPQELNGLFRLALRAGLWIERRHVAFALMALTDVHFKADGVRSRLHFEHLKALHRDEAVSVALLQASRGDGLDSPDRRAKTAQAHELTLQTLNDLAYLYGARSGDDSP